MVLETVLLVLLLVYFSTFTGLALIKGRKSLEEYSQGKDDKDYLFQSQNSSLTLAGLAVTAIALIISLRFEGTLSSLANFSAIILFFSISFVTLALSWNLTRFPKGIYHFMSGVLSDIGVLSIGCGFLVFFWRYFPVFSFSFFEVPLTFSLFIVAFLYFAYLDFCKRFRSLTKKSQKQ